MTKYKAPFYFWLMANVNWMWLLSFYTYNYSKMISKFPKPKEIE